jgi:hypothetical protein
MEPTLQYAAGVPAREGFHLFLVGFDSRSQWDDNQGGGFEERWGSIALVEAEWEEDAVRYWRERMGTVYGAMEAMEAEPEDLVRHNPRYVRVHRAPRYAHA